MMNIQARIERFQDDEAGSMILLGLYLFMATLMLSGVALTVISHEETRLRLQNTIDVAVLAAADLNQQLDPRSVVIDYFDKAGLSENLKQVVVTESLNSREVMAEAEMSVNTLLMGDLTESSWTVNSVGAAREDISNIEVSLVLDSSGSMASQGRMTALKSAAKEFVDDILLTGSTVDHTGEVSISLIPYSTQVTMPSQVLSQMNLRNTHNYSSCVDFDASDFLSVALPTAQRSQTGHFDALSSGTTPYRWTCSPQSQDEALLFSQDAALLKQRIDAMQPYSYTSIDLGIKWGAAMLDPSVRPIISDMISQNLVDSDFAGRPFDHTTPNKMKVLVVMTDGENTTQHQLVETYASGPSDAWYFAPNNKWSVFVPGGDVAALYDQLQDVVPTWSNGTHGGGITGPQYGGGNGNNGCGIGSGWNNGNYRGGGWNNGGRGNNSCGTDDDDDTDADPSDNDPNASSTPPAGGTDGTPAVEEFFVVGDRDWRMLPYGNFDATRQDWQEVWANVTVRKHAEDFRYEQNYDYSVYTDWRSKVFTTVEQAEKDVRMANICAAAKEAGILVFTMGFEIGPANGTKMRNCASSENYYFDVDYDTIDLAFEAIANSINQLRLVQ